MEFPQPENVAPGNGYSHVATAAGQWVAIAGQVALDADGAFVGVGDPAAQAEQVFANLDACVRAAGATWAQVAKLNLFVTDIAYLPVIRAVRDRYVDTANPPASTAVQVVGLFSPDAMIEIEAYAIV
jgi:enamine deaminase RidA (YjgF/YER057c/UK114 family)